MSRAKAADAVGARVGDFAFGAPAQVLHLRQRAQQAVLQFGVFRVELFDHGEAVGLGGPASRRPRFRELRCVGRIVHFVKIPDLVAPDIRAGGAKIKRARADSAAPRLLQKIANRCRLIAA